MGGARGGVLPERCVRSHTMRCVRGGVRGIEVRRCLEVGCRSRGTRLENFSSALPRWTRGPTHMPQRSSTGRGGVHNHTQDTIHIAYVRNCRCMRTCPAGTAPQAPPLSSCPVRVIASHSAPHTGVPHFPQKRTGEKIDRPQLPPPSSAAAPSPPSPPAAPSAFASASATLGAAESDDFPSAAGTRRARLYGEEAMGDRGSA